MIDVKLEYTPQDFKSDQEIRWCAGCGDIAIINAVQKAMAELDHKKEDYAIISGIGCSSRFPYYMNTYGFHGIHGRAGAIASGVKTANPRLSVWQITGDGDALAIGGNHFIHEIRRNIDINVILFNNEIYGLTKGQFSPTSRYGQITKTSPFGTIEAPFNPGELTIGAQGKFFARGIDNNVKLNIEIFKEADAHRGTSIIEILQNCVIFNDGAHDYINDKAFRADRQIFVKHGQPLIFGTTSDKGIVLEGLKLKVVIIGQNGVKESDILVHDAHEPDPTLHLALINMRGPDFPMAMGVIRSVKAPTYDERIEAQIKEVQAKSSIKCMDDLLNSGNTWYID
jgi:2-oxoglutarate/2-oxoacid ferredoxin oxidoreductase subunit beta